MSTTREELLEEEMNVAFFRNGSNISETAYNNSSNVPSSCLLVGREARGWMREKGGIYE